MPDWMERERIENSKRYNRGFKTGYEAGIKEGIKQAEEKEDEDEEQSPAPDYSHDPEEIYFYK